MNIRHLLFATCIILLAGCSTLNIKPNSNELFKMVNFTQGKMREVNGEWKVYEETDDMEFGINGQCIFNHKQMPCMWHGFILEYDSHGNDVSLDCVARQNIPSNNGNPNEVTDVNTDIFKYSIPLKGNEVRFVNPQYVDASESSKTIVSETVCTVSGNVVLKFKQVFHYSETGSNTLRAIQKGRA